MGGEVSGSSQNEKPLKGSRQRSYVGEMGVVLRLESCFAGPFSLQSMSLGVRDSPA